MDKQLFILLIGLAVVAALPHQTIIRKLSPDLRYQYERDGNGLPHLVDLWETIGNMVDAARFNPDTQNVYHLFTRDNPTVSQVLVPGNDALVLASNFNATRRTAILIHGWMAHATSIFNAVLLPAFLDAEDMNVIVVDWCPGACTFNYPAALRNVVSSGASVARFITWLSKTTGADPIKFHVAGHSLGGQQSGIVGRNLDGQIEYITSLDPAANGWANNNNKFRATDGIYTEVIHTNVEASGYLTPLGDVDFYPNGGDHMPGCSTNACNHDRCFYYLAESLRSGGFLGQRCTDYQAALVGNCTLAETLPLGGLKPKFGAQGVYYMKTNASPPFSQG